MPLAFMRSSGAWLTVEHGALRLPGLFLLFYVAPYLGPERYGALMAAFATLALCSVVANLGLDGVALRELRHARDRHESVLGTLLVLRGLGGVAAALLVLFIASLQEGATRSLLLVLACAPLLQPTLEVLTLWFRANAVYRPTALAQLAGQSLGLGLRILLLGAGLGALGMAWAHVLTLVFASVVLAFAFKGRGGRLALRFERMRATVLLREGAWVFLGTAFSLLYLRVDLLMLQAYLGDAEAGRYAVAAGLSMALYFVPALLSTLRFPRTIDIASEGTSRLELWLGSFALELSRFAWGLWLLLVPLGIWVLGRFFGPVFAGLEGVFFLHSLALPLVFVRHALSQYLVVKRRPQLSALSHGLGAVANVLLNAALIPRYGPLGAAAATVAAYGVSTFLFPLAHAELRSVARVSLGALVRPWAQAPATSAGG